MKVLLLALVLLQLLSPGSGRHLVLLLRDVFNVATSANATLPGVRVAHAEHLPMLLSV